MYLCLFQCYWSIHLGMENLKFPLKLFFSFIDETTDSLHTSLWHMMLCNGSCCDQTKFSRVEFHELWLKCGSFWKIPELMRSAMLVLPPAIYTQTCSLNAIWNDSYERKYVQLNEGLSTCCRLDFGIWRSKVKVTAYFCNTCIWALWNKGENMGKNNLSTMGKSAIL